MSEGGVSQSYVDGQINRLESRINSRLHDLQGEINELERQMRDLAERVVNAIERQTHELSSDLQRQTAALVAEAVATVAMIESTKRQLAADFDATREKLDVQTEANLQVEIGKKIGDIKATHAKMVAFSGDIEQRYQKAMENAGANTSLYDATFRKIFDEFDQKIRTIGAHVYQIYDEVIQPMQESAGQDPDHAFRMSLEVDLNRLQARAEHLDDTLELLRSARLDEILNSTRSLDETLADNYAAPDGGGPIMGLLEGIACFSDNQASLALGVAATGVDAEGRTGFVERATGLQMYQSDRTLELVRATASQRPSRKASDGELEELGVAANRLVDAGRISRDDMMMLLDFLEQEELRMVG